MKKIILLTSFLTILFYSTRGFPDQCREIIDQEQVQYDVLEPINSDVAAQSFIAGCTRLSSIDLYLQMDEGEKIVLELYEEGEPGRPDERKISASAEITATESSSGWYRFDIQDIDLVPDKKYYIAIHGSSQLSSYRPAWAMQKSSNPYPHGEAWSHFNSSERFRLMQNNGDMTFRINCCAVQDELPSNMPTGFILFEKYILKDSGTYVLSGGYIDQRGFLWEYDNSNENWEPDYLAPGVIAGYSLLAKFSKAKLIGTVDYSLLEKMTLLIDGAAKGDLSRESIATNQGSTAYVAYLFDEETGSYREVILSKSGDWNVRNNSDEAKKLVEWLSKLWPSKETSIVEYDRRRWEKQKQREKEKRREEQKRREEEKRREEQKRREKQKQQLCEPPADITTGFVLFERFHVNYAWGYKLSGAYIDQKGDIWEYDHSDKKWKPRHITGCGISESDLKDKFRNAKHVGKVDPSRLEEMIALIDGVAKGELVQESHGADMGSTLYVAHAIDKATGAYRQFTISGYGDREVTNASDEAKKLMKWLSEVWPPPPSIGGYGKRNLKIKEKVMPAPLRLKIE